MIVEPFSGQPHGFDSSAASGERRTTVQLLTAFAQHRDQRAFELLTQQFGDLVYGVCRRVTGNHHDAEDAFQATFLLLARKARAVSHPEAMAVWLHRVAYHAALRTKMKIAAQQRKEVSMVDIPEPAFVESKLWAELEPELDQELNNLPEKYRLPVLLCDIGGKSHRDAAREIGCPEGTLASRLFRARELLAGRLTRRGIVLTSATLAVLLAQNAASAAAPAALIASTVGAVSAAGAAQTTAASTMFTKGMLLFKSTFQTVTLGKATLAGVASTGVLAAGFALQQPENAPAKAVPEKPAAVFEEIAATYRRNYDAIKSLRIEYQERTENLLDPEVMWQECDILPEEFEQLPTTVLVIEGENVAKTISLRVKGVWEIDEHLREKYPDKGKRGKPGSTAHNFTFAQIVDEFPQVPFASKEVVQTYDGKRFRSVGNMSLSGERVYEIFPVKSLMPMLSFTRPDYLDLMLYGFLGPKSEEQQKFKERWQLPDLLKQSTWQVIQEREALDGVECLVIESSKGDRLWLDPQLGYAVRRWTQTAIPWDVQYFDFQQAADDFYVPHKIVSLDFVPQEASAKYRGQPSVRRTREILNLEVNQPVAAETFRLTPPAGAIVFDHTFEPLDENGNPIDVGEIDRTQSPFVGHSPCLTYRQPADLAELKSVIAKRKTTPLLPPMNPEPGQTAGFPGDANRTASNSVASNTFRWFIALNVLFLLVVGGYFLAQRRTK